MTNNVRAARAVSIKPGFDFEKLAAYVAAADASRAPDQDELAKAYANHTHTRAIFAEHPKCLSDLIMGICAQEERLLPLGQKLLARLLRQESENKNRKMGRRQTGVVSERYTSAIDLPGSSALMSLNTVFAGSELRDRAQWPVPR